ncbi:MAG: pyridoxamine 5'-phosphate oxidase family protein [Candidatus Moranbacteria bacterium]|nr:pyridoxamine 5'-phosphate oxidase family protein [Candidatus Moranbacteria bacterium]
MKKNYDEPMFVDKSTNINAEQKINIKNNIRELLNSESFAVLSTQGDGQPYSSLICFAYSDDLKKLVFATPVETRKFNLIVKSDRVSILVDNRSNNPESLNQIQAVTITGKASILKDNNESQKWSQLLIKSHPYLEGFVKSPTTGIIKVNVCRYFYVSKFQEVIEWSPQQN